MNVRWNIICCKVYLNDLRNIIYRNNKLYFESPLSEKIIRTVGICQKLFDIYRDEELEMFDFALLLNTISIYFKQIKKLINTIEDEEVKKIV